MKEILVKIGRWVLKHKFLIAIAILVLAGAIYYGYSKNSSDTDGGEIKTATVKKGDISIVVTGTGQVHAGSQVDLKGVKAGDGIDVVEIAVENDQEVKEGDLIAVLDTADAMKDVQNASLSLQGALISQKETNNEFDNETVEEKWKRQSQEISVAQRRLALSNAQSDLDDYYIRAPFDGIVTDLSVEAGDSVSQSDAIASVITNDMYAKISLNEVDAAKVKKGNKVMLTFDALADLTIEGKVSRIDTIGKITSNVVSYDAEISFENTSDFLKPGMSVNAEIAIDSRENVLQVSNSAIKTNDDGSTYVRVMSIGQSAVDGGAAQSKIVNQTVEIGLTDDIVTEVISGLKMGDVVVTKMSSSASVESEEGAGGLLDSVRVPGTGGGGGRK